MADEKMYYEGVDKWSKEIRLVQNGDPTDGGENGPVNVMVKAVIDRTVALKKAYDTLQNNFSSLLQDFEALKNYCDTAISQNSSNMILHRATIATKAPDKHTIWIQPQNAKDVPQNATDLSSTLVSDNGTSWVNPDAVIVQEDGKILRLRKSIGGSSSGGGTSETDETVTDADISSIFTD